MRLSLDANSLLVEISEYSERGVLFAASAGLEHVGAIPELDRFAFGLVWREIMEQTPASYTPDLHIRLAGCLGRGALNALHNYVEDFIIADNSQILGRNLRCVAIGMYVDSKDWLDDAGVHCLSGEVARLTEVDPSEKPFTSLG